MGTVCSMDAALESPAEYVRYNRKIEFERMMHMISSSDDEGQGVAKSTEDMTVDELKAHYAKSGKDRWE